VATVLQGPQFGHRAYAGLEHDPSEDAPVAEESLQELADRGLAIGESFERTISIGGVEARVWVEYRFARPGLSIFGAGDDAQPLLRMAKELGWFVSIADGRSNLPTRDRFPLADELRVFSVEDLPGKPGGPPPALGALKPQDAAAVMTHSFDQDARILASLLALDAPLHYVGVLGPQRRTRELLAEAARLLNLPADPTSAVDAQVERWLGELHAPMGLDLGGESPEDIAFSVLAEIQKSLAGATALPLREVRGAVRA
jgi:xanthine/CO dehydrogenase XdhC/CoxF family maturation factor